MDKARAQAERGVVDVAAAAALRLAQEKDDVEIHAVAARWLEEAWAEERAVEAWNEIAKHPRASTALVTEAKAALADRPKPPPALSDAERSAAVDAVLRAPDAVAKVKALEPFALRGRSSILDWYGVLLLRAGRHADAQRAWARGRMVYRNHSGVNWGSYRTWLRSASRVLSVSGTTALVGGAGVDTGFTVDLAVGRASATTTSHYLRTFSGSMGCLDVVGSVGAFGAMGTLAAICQGGKGQAFAEGTTFIAPTTNACSKPAVDQDGQYAAFVCGAEVWLVPASYSSEPRKVEAKGGVEWLAISSAAGAIAAGNAKGEIAVFDMSGKSRGHLAFEVKEPVTGFVFAGKDRAVAAREGGSLEVYRLGDKKRIESISVKEQPRDLAFVPETNSVDLVAGNQLTTVTLSPPSQSRSRRRPSPSLRAATT